ncbi:P-loop containing nucleoside triphosphate hydrolase protein [Mycena pura]|uniref:RNA helicase n=1 Tax=Mycena pura TaxID=153505 RepID=A0AAD6VSK7_9AGAR|nr:P-loop containing nucleoside triphosphate hydrolase protein [Mycena pura]
MQGLLWARCRPRIASLHLVGHRFRTAKAIRRPPPRGKGTENEDNRLSSRGLEAINLSSQGVLAYFHANVESWTLRGAVRDRLVSFGAPSGDAMKLLSAFARDASSGFFDSPDATEKFQLMKLCGTDAMEADITFSNIFFRWLGARQTAQAPVRGVNPATVRTLMGLSDAATNEHPEEEFEPARRMRRKLIMHVGPTNSGKTYQALRALAASKVGVYAGPLRLLAHEIWERLNLGQVAPLGATEEQIAAAIKFGPSVDNPFARKCNMITGEEQKIVDDFATLTSCTVEMLRMHVRCDVAVIDEIQMIAEPERGSSWTRAVLGMCAQEIHLCGEETAVPLIEKIVKDTGDELVVNRYNRLTPLEVEKQSLEMDFSRIQKGDCFVTFSRSSIFALKKQVEQETPMKCAVVYGRLPPEIRSEQAALFNDPDSGYDVLIGSDAIGMGLNLKIRRVIFEAVRKFSGSGGVKLLSNSLIKQIAGRAGRFGMQGSDEKPGGFVTTLNTEDLSVLHKTMPVKIPALSQARLSLTAIHIANIVSNLPPDASTETIHLAAMHAGRFPFLYRAGLVNHLSTVGEYLDSQGHFTLADRLLLISAPFPWRDRTAMGAITAFLSAHYENMHVDVVATMTKLGYLEKLLDAENAMEHDGRKVSGRKFKPSVELKDLELFHKILVLYLWLSYRNPVAYAGYDIASEWKVRVEKVLHWCLKEMTYQSGGSYGQDAATKKPPIEFRGRQMRGFESEEKEDKPEAVVVTGLAV